MAPEKSIFGFRFGSNAELNPSTDELLAFLKNTRKAGSRDVHGKDLEHYNELLIGLTAFEDRHRSGNGSGDPRQKMFYGVLSQSQFANPGLLLAVGQYKYHLQNFAALDFKKPTAFIKTAEEERKKLNPKKKEDALKLARLGDMVEERRRTLIELHQREHALTEEMLQIPRYVRDNLLEVAKLCKASIVVLVEDQVSGRTEAQLLKNLKEEFDDQLGEAREGGAISQEQFDAANKEAAALSREISGLVRDDVYSITMLYEAIHDHVIEAAARIEALMTEAQKTGKGSHEEGVAFFSKIEQALLALVSGYHFELHTTSPQSKTQYGPLLLEKRKEMVDHFFDLLNRERRARSDRRTGVDRRRFKDSHLAVVEQRAGKERRSGRSRRD